MMWYVLCKYIVNQYYKGLIYKLSSIYQKLILLLKYNKQKCNEIIIHTISVNLPIGNDTQSFFCNFNASPKEVVAYKQQNHQFRLKSTAKSSFNFHHQSLNTKSVHSVFKILSVVMKLQPKRNQSPNKTFRRVNVYT